MHVANVEALRRAVARLQTRPSYVLTDGFPVDGLGVPGLAVWKGDRVAACIAAASVVAKVTRDRLMVGLDAEWPAYDFKTHKGYITDIHEAALAEHGPCPIHRMRFVNVRRAAGLEPVADPCEDADTSVGGGPGTPPEAGEHGPVEGLAEQGPTEQGRKVEDG
jgi:ribonuclease HII